MFTKKEIECIESALQNISLSVDWKIKDKIISKLNKLEKVLNTELQGCVKCGSLTSLETIEYPGDTIIEEIRYCHSCKKSSKIIYHAVSLK